MDTQEVTIFTFIGLLWSISSFLLDVGLDISLMVNYLISDKLLFFILTLLFFLIPYLVNVAFSVRMYKNDKVQNEMYPGSFTYGDDPRKVYLASVLTPLWRYVQTFRYAWRSKTAKDTLNQRIFYKWMIQEASDVALLRLLECFLEAAPQLTLQISILFHNHFDKLSHSSISTVVLRWLSIASSCFSMAWCMASYQRTLRNHFSDKQNLTKVAILFHLLWNFCITVSRILCVSLMVTHNWKWTITGLVIHWLAMCIWLFKTTTIENYFWKNNNTLGSALFISVFACVHIFTRVELNGGTTWRKYIIFYSVFAIETLTAVVVLVGSSEEIYSQDLYFIPIVYAVIGMFLFGVIFMIIYYTLLHPSIGVCYNDNGPVHEKYQFYSRMFKNLDERGIINVYS